MTTDNSPRTYIYLSRRLLEDRWAQHTARRRKTASVDGLTVGMPAVSVSFRRLADRDQNNLYWLSEKVTEAVRDNTGDLLYPGTYVRATLKLSWGFLGFVDPPDEVVAWIFGTAQTDEGTAFVALAGSIHNLTDYDPAHKKPSPVPFHISSPSGLRYLVDAYYDANATGKGMAVPDPQGKGDSISAAYRISDQFSPDKIIDSSICEVLFQVYEYAEDVSFTNPGPGGTGNFRAAMVGAALWVATAEPQPSTAPMSQGLPRQLVHSEVKTKRRWMFR